MAHIILNTHCLTQTILKVLSKALKQYFVFSVILSAHIDVSRWLKFLNTILTVFLGFNYYLNMSDSMKCNSSVNLHCRQSITSCLY